ncbi:hypothetical protein BMF94_1728 [Rhodotorula taiwanensis]|uniref:Uncharacterized protein n=1 Tax=Rhodotorula taiwanensis TaxID=741276 RepID=A0A2S5BEA0_9BASI|nr:hypothetical protein BMF94_1728 [Rhodotorula taiwanensis]
MALRRPPTAFTLKPSDVTDLQAFLKRRDEQEQQQLDPHHSTTTSGPGSNAQDELTPLVRLDDRSDRPELESRGLSKGDHTPTDRSNPSINPLHASGPQ